VKRSAATAEVREIRKLRKSTRRKAGHSSELFFSRDRREASQLARRGGVAAEDAEFACGGADFGEGGIETSGCLGFDVDEKLIFPGAAVDGTAFDLEEIDSVLGKWLEGGKERAGAVGEAHRQRNFASLGGNP